jgi:ABC-type spermidine/putrescine transport system permease subunit I
LAHTALGALRWRHVVALAQPRRCALIVFAVAGVLGVLVYHFSEPHPFLLADNRHYTFYLWRRVLDRHGVYWRAVVLGTEWRALHCMCCTKCCATAAK